MLTLTRRFLDGSDMSTLLSPLVILPIAARFAEETATMAAASDVARIPAVTNEYSATDPAGTKSTREHKNQNTMKDICDQFPLKIQRVLLYYNHMSL